MSSSKARLTVVQAMSLACGQPGLSYAGMQAIPPTWKSNDSGAWVVDKTGTLLFTFAKGLGKSGRPKAGEARFDWQNKQVGHAVPCRAQSADCEGCSCAVGQDGALWLKLAAQIIALSPVEFCTLVEHAGPSSKQEKVEFFHDPNMNSP